ncbi:GDSL esterase/lipase [Vitis vinifera]|uniref:GDSL esterase/lipase n=1 Tax=Vitis vinifera TaxID=29760 RepID=A0A438IBU4_VITVI|nr:GDSL esterase/lipase [Vitis vinifera]
MENQPHSSTFVSSFASLTLSTRSTEAHVPGGGFTKLFVFGDSYVDTGNGGRQATSWKKPYGIIFPGKPTGRYSDGRVFTDYIGTHAGYVYKEVQRDKT